MQFYPFSRTFNLTLSFFLYFTVAALVWTPGAYSMENIFSFMRPAGFKHSVKTELDFQSHKKQNIEALPTEWYHDRSQAKIFVPLMQDSVQMLSVSARGELWMIETGPDFALPKGKIFDQRNFWDVGISLGYTREKQNLDKWGFMFGVNSASDSPFHSYDEMNLSGTGFYMLNLSRKSSWVFFLNLGTNRGNLSYLPLPGVVWFFTPSRHFQLALGVPVVFARYMPIRQFEISAFVMAPVAGELNIIWRPIRYVHPFAQAKIDEKTFFRTNRLSREDRLFIQGKEVSAGLRFPWSREGGISVKVGQAYDRRFFEARTRSSKGNGILEFDDGMFWAVNVKHQF